MNSTMCPECGHSNSAHYPDSRLEDVKRCAFGLSLSGFVAGAQCTCGLDPTAVVRPVSGRTASSPLSDTPPERERAHSASLRKRTNAIWDRLYHAESMLAAIVEAKYPDRRAIPATDHELWFMSSILEALQVTNHRLADEVERMRLEQ